MTDVTQEMMAVIEKSLPAATAGAMSDFIIEAKATKDSLAAAELENDKLEKHISRMQEENAWLNDKFEDQEKLKAREDDLIKSTENLRIRERDINLEIANANLAAANDRNNKIEVLVEKVFGHPSVHVSTFRNKPIMVDSGNGCAPYQSGSTSENEDTTTSETKT